jgi:hypothetical protein
MAGYLGNIPSAVPLTSADIADGIITSAKIADGTIVNADINASAGIVTSKLSGALGITEADQWRLTTNLTGSNDVISANLERIDTAGQGTLGTGMTQSSGIFTFPSTGYWLVMFAGNGNNAGTADNMTIAIEATTNNSTYATIALTSDSSGGVAQTQQCTFNACSLVDVTSTTNVKVRFSTSSFMATSILVGDTTLNWATFTFIRLGDT